MTKDRQKCVLNMSDIMFNTLPEMAEIFESFITLSNDLPDEILLNERQYFTYFQKLNDLATRLGMPNMDSKNMTFRGIKVKYK